MPRFLTNLCGWQMLACLIGGIAGLLPHLAYQGSFWGLGAKNNEKGQPVVVLVVGRSPAEASGLQAGDVIQVQGEAELLRILAGAQAGVSLPLPVRRGDQPVEITLRGVEPKLVSAWYRSDAYPFGGGILLVLGVLLLITQPMQPPPLWRAVLVLVTGLGLAVWLSIVWLKWTPLWTWIIYFGGADIKTQFDVGGWSFGVGQEIAIVVACVVLLLLGAVELRGIIQRRYAVPATDSQRAQKMDPALPVTTDEHKFGPSCREERTG